MDLTELNLIKKQGIYPSKRLGQNFLIDRNVVEKIIKSAALSKNDIVLEIGPGLGVLTQELAKRAQKVIAIEKDKKLIAILRKNISIYQNIKILQGDILKINLPCFMFYVPCLKVVANLPYNIALPVIRKFIEAENPPQAMTLMIQKEVAQKICGPKSSLPKIAVQFYAKPEILFCVPKTSFWPEPKVDGAVIKITDIQKNIPKVDKGLFFKIVKLGFSQPRKTLLNNLSRGLKLEKEKVIVWLKKSQINPRSRPENLNLKKWIKLVDGLISNL